MSKKEGGVLECGCPDNRNDPIGLGEYRWSGKCHQCGNLCCYQCGHDDTKTWEQQCSRCALNDMLVSQRK